MNRGLTAAVVTAAVLVAARGGAHEVGLSRGEYVASGATVRVELVFARKELIKLVAGLDADHDGALTEAEIAAGSGSIEGALVGRVEVEAGGAKCQGALERAELLEQDGVAVHALYRCAQRPQRLRVELAFLDDLAFGHRHLARASAGAASIDRVLSQRSPSLFFDVPPDTAPTASDVARREAPPWRRGALGMITRYQGPALLLALLATCSGRRAALLTAAAFAGAAAIGFGMGAGGLLVPDPRVLGVALALSLVYAGLESLGSPDGAARWRVALPFGVVHGLGYAAAAPSGTPRDLAAFGAGVALALIVLISVLVPIASWMRRRPMFASRGAPALGVLIAAVGAIGLIIGRT